MFSTPPNKILLDLGVISIHWYGLLVVAGFFLGLLVLVQLFKKYKLPVDEAYDLFFYTILFGLLGARIYYVAYAWSYYATHPTDIVKIWQGGLAIHGAIIAAVLTVYFYSQRKGWNPWKITDLVATGVPIAMALGRWGNYFNQELFGTPTDLPWGIPIDLANRPEQYVNFSRFHPTFLYESLLDLCLFALLLLMHRRRLQSKQGEGRGYGAGNVTLVFLFGYSFIRFLMEFFRTDYSPVWLDLRWAQLLSLVIMMVIVVVTLWKFIKQKTAE
ncbi:prolipoprotein diacylglyceryl transferase [Candidatus Falkowbacteria bacterium]|nr:prolipoprotein diacylglyceryl transferase [Candidatus Falkowbacteria bacterium]